MGLYAQNAPGPALAPGDSAFLFGVKTAVALASPGLSRNGGVVTATTGAAHGFVPGQQVDIYGAASIGGFSTPYGFEGSFQIVSVPTTTTFTYNDPGKPNDSANAGFASSIQGENPATGAFSQQVSLANAYGFGVAGVGAEILFGAAPGNFSIDFLEADADAKGSYVVITAANITQAALGPSGLACRVDISQAGFKGKFLLARMTSAPANGNVFTLIKLTNRGAS